MTVNNGFKLAKTGVTSVFELKQSLTRQRNRSSQARLFAPDFIGIKQWPWPSPTLLSKNEGSTYGNTGRGGNTS
jgi:hypothetical protein